MRDEIFVGADLRSLSGSHWKIWSDCSLRHLLDGADLLGGVRESRWMVSSILFWELTRDCAGIVDVCFAWCAFVTVVVAHVF